MATTVREFIGFQPTAVDSISGFSLVNDVTQTVTVNDVTAPATTCSVGTPANGCTTTSGAGVLFPVTGTGGLNDEGYYTIGASIADRAGNSVALPGTMIAIDRSVPVVSGGVAIPAALVGGTPISLTEAVTDNMTLMARRRLGAVRQRSASQLRCVEQLRSSRHVRYAEHVRHGYARCAVAHFGGSSLATVRSTRSRSSICAARMKSASAVVPR